MAVNSCQNYNGPPALVTDFVIMEMIAVNGIISESKNTIYNISRAFEQSLAVNTIRAARQG